LILIPTKVLSRGQDIERIQSTSSTANSTSPTIDVNISTSGAQIVIPKLPKKPEDTKIETKKAPQSLPKITGEYLDRATIKQLVIDEFGADSVMVNVASCESRYRQFKPDGTLFRGIQNPKDVGVFQVNEYYHLEASKKMGIDIYTIEGNIRYARYLYSKNGTRDWNWSKPMWSKGECI
jgi:hypothetical protein